MADPTQSGPQVPAPDSVVFNQFAGVKNTVGTERLQPNELAKGQNIDIDDVGQARRRRGYRRVATGKWHSAWTSETGVVYGVKDGILGIVYPNFTFASLNVAIGDERLAYVQVAHDVYFSNSQIAGVVRRDGSVDPWGAAAAAPEWFSPIQVPTDTLGQVGGRLFGPPPLATALCYYNGRIYLAHKNAVWATELYRYGAVDRTLGFWQFEQDVTFLGAVSDGIYVGTKSEVRWVAGTFREANSIPVVAYAGIPGSCLQVPAELLIPQQRRPAMISKNAVIFLTDSGLMVGFDGGICNGLSQDTVLFPSSENVAALFRRQDGVNQYVAVMDSGGTPTSNARIGDYVDAEIRRANGA